MEESVADRPAFRRSMTQSDAELSASNRYCRNGENASDDSSVLSNAESTEWNSDFDEEEEGVNNGGEDGKLLRKERCSSSNLHALDIFTGNIENSCRPTWTAIKRAWTDLSIIAKLVILIVTPFAARQLGSWTARRMWTRWFGRP